jgi:hypothetical protein
MLLLMKQPATVMISERTRHKLKESRGVRYSVKNADIIAPIIPPMLNIDQA